MVTSSYPLFEGDGTAPFIEEIVRGVVARGHAVDVVLPTHPSLHRKDEAGIRFFPFNYSPHRAFSVWGYAQSMNADRGFKWKTLLVAPFAALATRAAVSARLRAEQYDVVHAQWVIPGGALSRGPVVAHGRPFVISLHGSDVFAAERNRVVGRLARLAFEAAGAITACSSDLRVRAIMRGAPAGRTRTVPYGVDAGFFRQPERSGEARRAMRTRLGADLHQTLVVGVGRLVEKKGFAHLIEAMTGMKEAHLALIGDGDLYADLRSLALARGASVTLAGRFSRHEVVDAFSCADIVAVPSVIDSRGNVDGLPNSLLEAMAGGKALIASRIAGIPDVVTDGVEGVLVPPGDPLALAAAIRSLASNPEMGARLGNAACLRASGDLTWERVAETLEECYVQAQTLAQRPRN